MNTKTVTVLTQSRQRFVAEAPPETVSAETKELVTFGQKRYWQEIGYLGNAPMPTETVNLGDWLLEPAHLSQRPVPGWVLGRVKATHEAGFRPRWVLAHEVTNLLPPPPKPEKKLWRDVVRPGLVAAKPKVAAIGTAMLKTSEKALPVVWEVTKVAAKATLTTAAVVGTGVAGVVATATVGAFAAAVAAMAVDPVLVAVMDDNSWICVAYWFDDGK